MRGDASGIFFMFSYFVVAIGGALGTVGRFWLSGAIAQRFGETFPAGTLIVNISGSFIIGFFAALTGPDGRIWSSPSFRQFFMIGMLGGYTTFSSFTLQTLALARDGEWLFAALRSEEHTSELQSRFDLVCRLLL